MKITNFLNKLRFLGFSAPLLLSVLSCDVGGNSTRESEEVEYEDEAVIEENIHTEVLEDENEPQTLRNEGYFTSWDRDEDGLVDPIEYGEGWSVYMPDEEYDENFFNEWDENEDKFLDKNEFQGAIYNYYDVNDDGSWDKEEFSRFTLNYYFGTQDSDKNNQIAENEFEETWKNFIAANEYTDNMFDEWDTDKNRILDDDEFAESVFNQWDTDNSGKIERNEYKTNF